MFPDWTWPVRPLVACCLIAGATTGSLAAGRASAPSDVDPAGARAVLAAAERQLRLELDRADARLVVEPLIEASALGAVDPRATPVARRLGAHRAAPRMTVRVDLVVDGRVERQVVVPFSVVQMATALVARRDIGAGESFEESDCEAREVDVATFVSPVLRPGESLRGWRARTVIARGRPLLSDQVVARRDVMAGDAVVVTHDAGTIRVEVDAIAQQDGDPGEVIRVKSPSMPDSIRVRVASAGHAELLEVLP